MVKLIVNGTPHNVDVGDDVPLVFALHDGLGLLSPKVGCGLEQCGSCKVLVDGEPVFSCVTPVKALEGRRIETVEGFADGATLHPVQQALLDHNAAQCGYCLSGIVVAAKALFDRNARPSGAEIRAALDDHLCRCGAQPRVVRALTELANNG
jgi:nicotinate dehydrogenase subunit A